ncbi:hypothetical protein JTE90_026012, partial [Oedothorax gibbosus]
MGRRVTDGFDGLACNLQEDLTATPAQLTYGTNINCLVIFHRKQGENRPVTYV